MSTRRKLTVGIACVSTLLILSAGFAIARHVKTPLGYAPPIQFQSTSAPDAAVRQFLDSDFVIIKDVNALPGPVLKAFTEIDGARPVMANPGKKFEVTDVIIDASVPRERLIFAGVSGDKCFVHYERGGIGHSYLLGLFRLTSANTMTPVWGHNCGPAANIADLRSQVASGCAWPRQAASQPTP
jgi:hypothetical protein